MTPERRTAVRKLAAAEMVAVRAPVLRRSPPPDDATGFAALYVADLDQADGLEGHRICWGQVSFFLTADERYEHVCVSTILAGEMPVLVIVRDRVRGEILGHYFAATTEFPWDEEM
jgi:hypothetical protein